MRDFSWSSSEKEVARRVFERALEDELQELVREVKEKAAKLETAEEAWNLESWLSERRREINRKYDYRYSVLPIVFGTLLAQRRIRESDLEGLGPEKIRASRSLAEIMAGRSNRFAAATSTAG